MGTSLRLCEIAAAQDAESSGDGPFGVASAKSSKREDFVSCSPFGGCNQQHGRQTRAPTSICLESLRIQSNFLL